MVIISKNVYEEIRWIEEILFTLDFNGTLNVLFTNKAFPMEQVLKTYFVWQV